MAIGRSFKIFLDLFFHVKVYMVDNWKFLIEDGHQLPCFLSLSFSQLRAYHTLTR